MTPDKYRHLEKIFASFNEAIVQFHSDIIDAMPVGCKPEVLVSMKDLLDLTNEKYRSIQDEIFRYEQRTTPLNKI